MEILHLEAKVLPLLGSLQFRVHTNRWDPRSSYPGSTGVVLRLRMYLSEYLSDFHNFCISLKK